MDKAYLLYLISKEADPGDELIGVGGIDIEDISPAPEASSLELDIIPVVLDIDELRHNGITAYLLTNMKSHSESLIIILLTYTVDT